MRLKLTHITHISHKIANDFIHSKLLELKAPRELLCELIEGILEKSVKKKTPLMSKPESF